MELKKYSTTVDKIITCGHILLIKVSRWPSWHKYSNQTKLSRFGLASVTMAAILDFQNYISQPFEVLKGSNSVFKLISPKPITGTNMSWLALVGLPMVTILDFQRVFSEPFKELKVVIWNSSLLLPNLLLWHILILNWVGWVWKDFLWWQW